MIDHIATENNIIYGILPYYDFIDKVWSKVGRDDEGFVDMKKHRTLRYFCGDLRNMFSNKDHRYAFVVVDDEIVAISKLMQGGFDITEETPWSIPFTEVSDDFQGLGFARKLMDIVFKWAKVNNANLESTGYTKVGYLTLKPLKEKLSIQYGVNHNERNEKHGWTGDINKPAHVQKIEDDYQKFLKRERVNYVKCF